MNKRIFVLLFVGLSFVVDAQTLRLSQAIETTANHETFGALLDDQLPTVTLSALSASPVNHLGVRFALQAPIAKVCQQKGCFFIIQAENRVFRVSFKDYGFFIPTDSGGKNVLLNGELVQKELTPDQAAHFQEDLQSNAESIRAGIVYEIVADSIRIPIS